MKLLKVDTLEEAREKLKEFTGKYSLQYKKISLDEVIESCRGMPLIVSEDIYASSDIPNFRRSTVDGYAVIASDTFGAGEAIPVLLKQAGTVSMGKEAGFSIKNGECAYVPTGGMLPGGADAVAMVEYCDNSGGSIAVYKAAAPLSGVADIGEDFRKGDLLLGRGTFLKPAEAGALAAAGIMEIPVFMPLKISIISIGDELVSPETSPKSGEIRDINSYALKALAERRGFRVVSSCRLPDDEEKLEGRMKEMLPESDVVIISGGSSKGDADKTAAVMEHILKPGIFTHGLSLKPGKPTILGWDEKSRTIVCGLPGNPAAALITFELILGWFIDRIFSRPSPFPIPARVSSNVPGSPGRSVVLPVRLRLEEDGYAAEPVFGKSGMVSILTRSDGYAIIENNREGLKKGETVLVHLW